LGFFGGKRRQKFLLDFQFLKGVTYYTGNTKVRYERKALVMYLVVFYTSASVRLDLSLLSIARCICLGQENTCCEQFFFFLSLEVCIIVCWILRFGTTQKIIKTVLASPYASTCIFVFFNSRFKLLGKNYCFAFNIEYFF